MGYPSHIARELCELSAVCLRQRLCMCVCAAQLREEAAIRHRILRRRTHASPAVPKPFLGDPRPDPGILCVSSQAHLIQPMKGLINCVACIWEGTHLGHQQLIEGWCCVRSAWDGTQTVGAIIIWSLADFRKIGTVYNFNHRYNLTLRDRISQKNPE